MTPQTVIDDEEDRGDPRERHEHAPRPAGDGRPVDERHEQERQPAEPEEHDPDHLALDARDVRGEVLQRLEHEQEVPLGLDVRRSDAERVGLLSELPGKDRGEGGQQPERDVPADHVAQEEVREERHRADARPPSLVFRQHRLRDAHPVSLHEVEVDRPAAPS